jgi:hypothetical protein
MMTRVRRGDVILTVALLTVFAGAYALSLAWPFRTALFPRLVSAAGVILALVQLAALAARARRATVVPDETAPVHRGGEDEGDHSVGYVFASAGGRAWGAALGWIAAFFVSLWLVGAVPTVPAFALLYLRVAGGASWRAAAVYAVVAGVVVFAVFGRLLSVPMPTGVL